MGKLTFRLYSTATPTSASFLWGEAHQNVVVRRGVFTVNLGEGDQVVAVDGTETPGSNPLTAAVLSEPDRFIEVQVDAEAPLAPTARLGSVPFAIVAGGSPPVGAIMDWYRPDQSTVPPDGWAICDGSTVNDAASPFNGKTLPNLIGAFTKGTSLAAGYGSQPSGALGLPDTGGQNSVSLNHSHGLGNHSHSFSFNSGTVQTSTAGGHGHTANLGDSSGHIAANPLVNHGSGLFYINSLVGPGPNCSHNFPVHVQPVGGHSHSVTLAGSGTTNSAGGSTSNSAPSFDNQPAFVGLVKIIRIK
ncbi:MAG TPA: hypothetical protein DEA08_29450 [Planctomycetes bacterium]|nr:hypothetical protein [Planctomycetota bacterium]